ncbi:MAG: hypothetical protein MJ108_06015 [Saccharofermentans sp.]|nr:hypothetical protein [Saccharofermentans sp.]
MGAGYHGGFGSTSGSKKINAISASSSFVGTRQGDMLKEYAKAVKEEPGFTDVVIHGNPNNAEYYHNGKWVKVDQRTLALMLKKDSGYKSGSIRLISCSTGMLDSGFAQNLANKMGVSVKAPTDTVWVWPTGRMTIGPSQFQNTGTWKIYKPQKKGR